MTQVEDNNVWKQLLFDSSKALVLVCFTLVIAYFVAPYISDYLEFSVEQVKIFRLVAMGMIAWGVLGRLTFESFDRITGPEIFDRFWFKSLYILGLFLAGLALLIEPTK